MIFFLSFRFTNPAFLQSFFGYSCCWWCLLLLMKIPPQMLRHSRSPLAHSNKHCLGFVATEIEHFSSFFCFSWWRFPTNIFVSFSILSITRIFNFGRICNVFLSCWHNCRQAGIQIPPPTDGWCQVPKRLTFLHNVCTDICVCVPPYVYVL